MPFPDAERLIFEKNPLEGVVCQLRFPTILAIDSEIAAFQQRIREEYPLYRQQVSTTITMIPGFVQHNPAPQTSYTRIHEFLDESENCIVSLSRDFISIVEKKYERWELFEQRFLSVLESLKDTNKPSFYTRIGLRYTNVIRRSSLIGSAKSASWSELLNPCIAGPFSDPDMTEDELKTAATQYSFALDEYKAKVLLQTALRPAKGEETTFLIDADVSTQQKAGVNDVPTILRYLNRHARNAFQWSISKLLRDALGRVEDTDKLHPAAEQ